MSTNELVIQKFYSSFQSKDYRSMQEYYADEATFSDPVFVNLNSLQVKAMWEMFCVNGKDLNIQYKIIYTDEVSGRAEWKATYIFSATGKRVVNNITSHFTFREGKILKHNDNFSFYKWARQALGVTGLILGWTPFLKTKVQKTAMKTLGNYMNKK